VRVRGFYSMTLFLYFTGPVFWTEKTYVSGPILILLNLTGILDPLPNIDPCPSPRKFSLIGPLFWGSLNFQKWRVQLSISLAKKTIIHATLFWIKARNDSCRRILTLQCCMCCNPTNDFYGIPTSIIQSLFSLM
jgi:hypothetical protein